MILVLLIILLIFYLLFHFQRAYCMVYENCHPKRVSASTMEEIPYKTKQFSFCSRDGILLAAVEWLPKQKIKGTIIACHYLGGSKNAIYPYIEPLLKVGYRVTAFDYPNHGESMDRKSIKYDLEEEMKLFICKIKELGMEGPYAAIGFSMGASLALSTTVFCKEIKVVVVDSGPLVFVKEYVEYVMRNKKTKNYIEKIAFLFFYFYIVGFRKMSKKIKKRVKEYFELPVLIIHGKRDQIIPVRNTEYLYEKLDLAKSKRVLVDRSHHLTNRILLGEKYDKMTVEFITKNLAGIADEKGKNIENIIR